MKEATIEDDEEVSDSTSRTFQRRENLQSQGIRPCGRNRERDVTTICIIVLIY